jgi:hypothetical protein
MTALCFELLAQLLGDAHRVGARTVALVDERDARHAVAPHLAVDGDRLALHAGHRAQDEDGAVEHRRARSTSMVKSTWPGVSMMLTWWSSHIVWWRRSGW